MEDTTVMRDWYRNRLALVREESAVLRETYDMLRYEVSELIRAYHQAILAAARDRLRPDNEVVAELDAMRVNIATKQEELTEIMYARIAFRDEEAEIVRLMAMYDW